MGTRKVAAGLLLGGLLVFVVLVPDPGVPRAMERGGRPVSIEALEAVAAHPAGWLRVRAVCLLAALATLCGAFLLTLRLWNGGERVLAPLAFLLLALGTCLWMCALAFHGAVTADAAALLKAGAPRSLTVDQWRDSVWTFYEPLARWAEGLYNGFMGLSYLSAIGFGVALKRKPVIPPLAGTLLVLFGAIWFWAFVIQFPDFKGRTSDLSDSPLWIHAWGAFVGAMLLASPWRYDLYGTPTGPPPPSPSTP